MQLENNSMECPVPVGHVAQQQPSYTTYEQLDPIELEQNIFQILNDVVKNEGDWVENFNNITKLRRYNKHAPQAFRCLLEQEYQNEQYFLLNVMSNWVSSIRSNVQKNALILYKEIIKYNQIELLKPNSLVHLLFKVFEKSDIEYKFLKQEALSGLDALNSKQYQKFEVNIIEALYNICLNQSPKVQQFSYPALVKALRSMPNVSISPVWLGVFKATILITNGKSVECKKQAAELINFLQKNNLWEDSLLLASEQECENNLQENLRLLGQAKSKNDSNATSRNFRQFVAQQKQGQQTQEQQTLQNKDNQFNE